eukprot:CAMPEP_0114298770 /NCGR_PEP_ID=MMETSP0059-20121206/12604_1 /TAXON_ID=36894 /ORGANISM="Pyramimonas parkeae, Strain CCMP726" /LENGTH=409 /DNA_ID=CAMNT_0001421171 /DNA_START=157 /DNA_END=1386 /DNA_ORIENTATION=-
MRARGASGLPVIACETVKGNHGGSKAGSLANPLGWSLGKRRRLVGCIGLGLACLGMTLLMFVVLMFLWAKSLPHSDCDLKLYQNPNFDPYSANAGPCQRARLHADVDVVVVAVKPTCVTPFAIRGLNFFMGPRTIYVIAPTQTRCAVFAKQAQNVVCIVEDQVVPGLNKKVVGEYIEKLYQASGSSIVYGRSMAGWYLQQFLKMGVARHLDGLSEHYLLWDSDMVPLKPMDWFRHNRTQVLFNTGGYLTPTYDQVYERLMGTKMSYAADGTSFVTHSMMIYRPYMEALMLRFNMGKGGNGWIYRILDQLDTRDVQRGFSEYGSYASWMIENHSEKMAIVPYRTWSRHPIGGVLGMQALRLNNEYGLCCPNKSILQIMRLLDNAFVGFEIGHHFCHATDSKYEDAYGISE